MLLYLKNFSVSLRFRLVMGYVIWCIIGYAIAVISWGDFCHAFYDLMKLSYYKENYYYIPVLVISTSFIISAIFTPFFFLVSHSKWRKINERIFLLLSASLFLLCLHSVFSIYGVVAIKYNNHFCLFFDIDSSQKILPLSAYLLNFAYISVVFFVAFFRLLVMAVRFASRMTSSI